MNIEIPSFKSIELKKISDCKEIHYKVSNYQLNEDLLEGVLHVNGEYYTDSLDSFHEFNENIDFSVYFDQPKYIIEEVRVEHFDYEVVVGRGIELLFTLEVEYIEQNDIKEEIVEEVDNLLANALANRDDSFLDESDSVATPSINREIQLEEKEVVNEDTDETPNNEIIDSSENVTIESFNSNDDVLIDFPRKYTCYKLIFIKDESEVEEIASKYNKSVSNIYRDNNYNINKRILIKCDE